VRRVITFVYEENNSFPGGYSPICSDHSLGATYRSDYSVGKI